MIIYEVYMNPKNAVIYDMKVAKKNLRIIALSPYTAGAASPSSNHLPHTPYYNNLLSVMLPFFPSATSTLFTPLSVSPS